LRNQEVQIRTCIPARIIRYDNNNRRAVVRVEVQKKHGEDDVTIADIEDVPVWEYVMGKFKMGLDPDEGQEGMLHVCDREIETWKINGGVSPMRYARLHQISDSWFMPGAFSDPASADLSNKTSIIQCSIDLAEQTRDLALQVTPPRPDIAAQIQQIINKLEG